MTLQEFRNLRIDQLAKFISWYDWKSERLGIKKFPRDLTEREWSDRYIEFLQENQK